MAQCPSCGGTIGRDCFNPNECAEITRSMEMQYYAEDYLKSVEQSQDIAFDLACKLDSCFAMCYIDESGNISEVNAYEIEGQIRAMLDEMDCVIIKRNSNPPTDTVDDPDGLPF